MKQSIISLTTIILCILSSYGQLPQWTIFPECDTIYIKYDNVIEGQRKGENVIWNSDGKRLFSTINCINAYSDGVATIQPSNSNKLEGFVDVNGIFIELPKVETAHHYPYFEDGFLVAKQSDDYVMYGKNGEEAHIPFIHTLYPYSNGYATYIAYEQPEKKKNRYFNLLKNDGTPVKSFVIKENDKTKEIEPKDISFLSSVGADTWRALAVVKNKLYWFDTFEMCLLPIQVEDEKNKKRQLTLESNKDLNLAEFPTDSITLIAKGGKDQLLEFRFDHMLRLTPKYNNTAASKYATKKYAAPTFASELTTYSDGKTIGIINKKDTLPCQFEEIGIKYDNKTFVKMNGKWGVIELIPDCDYSISINDGEDISFAHRTTDAKLKIELPSRIDANKVTIDFPKSSGIQLDKSSRNVINTEKGNCVVYNCTLEIPSELTDTIGMVDYGSGTVIVDNVSLPSRDIRVNAKYENNFAIEIPSPDAQISNGEAAFEIRVNHHNVDNKYPYEFSFGSNQFIDSNSIVTSHQQVNENCYMCIVNVADLRAGFNQFEVKITEDGCPTLTFPIKIDYSAARKKEKATIIDLSKEQNDDESQLNVTKD